MSIPTRKQWQELKKADQVPTGAAKVSIGDSIEKFHKSYKSLKPTTAAANLKDTKQLIKDLEVYVAALKAKKTHAAFANKVEKNVRGAAALHLERLEAGMAAFKRYPTVHKETAKTLKLFSELSAKRSDALNAVVDLLELCEKVDGADRAGTWSEKRVAFLEKMVNQLKLKNDLDARVYVKNQRDEIDALKL